MMEILDYRHCIVFQVDYLYIAELHFTPDFGNVLLINPRCMVYANPRYYSGLEGIRPEYRQHFKRIT